MSRTTSSTIIPAVPVVPATPIKVETPTKVRKGKQPAVQTAPAAVTKALPATPTKSPSKAAIAKTQPIDTSTKTEAAAKKTETKEKKSAPETPVKAGTKGKSAIKKADKAEKPVGVGESSQKTPASEIADLPITVGTPNTNTKRQHPGKLEIPMAKVVEKEPTPITGPRKAEPQPKNVRAMVPTSTPSAPASPATAVAPSPIKHTAAPRTLRLVSTPKAEIPPTVVAPTPPLPQIPTMDKLRSRQASIASLNPPGTPASELISDTASMTSGMISRAGSPPPTSTIVGSAPVRKITKAQAKKNRQERKRQEEGTVAAEDKSDVEVVQAPIVGRKKKAKKPSTTPKPVAAMASAMAAAAKSQPASPKSVTVEDEPLELPTVASVKAQSTRNSASATPEPEYHPEEVRERREPSAQSVLNELQKTGELLVSALEFFKPLSSTLTHGSRTNQAGLSTSPPDMKIHFSEADLDLLARKKPVRLSGHEGKPDSRTLITPNGKFFWGLSHELEEKALQLEAQIEQLTGQTRFHPTSRTSHQTLPYSPTSDMLPAIATALKEAGKKLNPHSPTRALKFDPTAYSQQLPHLNAHDLPPPNLSPPPVQQQTPADAGAYLNQFVLPKTDNPPPNQPRPEMAAVGGPPGSGTASISVQASRFEKAARAVVEGGAVGSTEIDGLGSIIGDKRGGVFVKGLESLVSAGLGLGASAEPARDEDLSSAFEGRFEMGPDNELRSVGSGTSGWSGSSGGVANKRSAPPGRGSVLSLEEAEAAMLSARREHEVLERKLAGLMKKNKKLATGNAR